MAPYSIDFEQSKFNGLTGPSVLAPTINIPRIYLKNSIMVIRVQATGPLTYQVSVGDVIRLESDVVDGNFVVNRISQLSNSQKYIYMFTNFNENIITNVGPKMNMNTEAGGGGGGGTSTTVNVNKKIMKTVNGLKHLGL